MKDLRMRSSQVQILKPYSRHYRIHHSLEFYSILRSLTVREGSRENSLATILALFRYNGIEVILLKAFLSSVENIGSTIDGYGQAFYRTINTCHVILDFISFLLHPISNH